MKPTYFPYPHWIALILPRIGEDDEGINEYVVDEEEVEFDVHIGSRYSRNDYFSSKNELAHSLLFDFYFINNSLAEDIVQHISYPSQMESIDPMTQDVNNDDDVLIEETPPASLGDDQTPPPPPKTRSSSAAGGSSAPPAKKCNLKVDLEDIIVDGCMTIEEVIEIMLEDNTLVRTRRDECQTIKISHTLASTDAQETSIQRLNIDVAKQNRVFELKDRINRKKFEIFVSRRYQTNPIIKFRCTKPKNKLLKMHLAMKNVEYEYTKAIFAHAQEVQLAIQHKNVHAQEIKLANVFMLRSSRRRQLLPPPRFLLVLAPPTSDLRLAPPHRPTLSSNTQSMEPLLSGNLTLPALSSNMRSDDLRVTASIAQIYKPYVLLRCSRTLTSDLMKFLKS
ncbi:unnamed protein product [Lactuca saligna]|uniref:Uncharacterized protein n=1 Tax=Lactuca saligna TaxID=75948 RepID=A0AA36A413_LACSI|nr:unnamed protein product [Lactuca saligna]